MNSDCFALDYYVYVYLNPLKPGNYEYGPYKFECEPFYVGKGRDYRFRAHMEASSLKKDNNRHKTNTIKKILSKELEPVILKLEDPLTDYESKEIEKWLIKLIGRADLIKGPLANLTDGGEGTTGWNPSEEYRQKKREENSKRYENEELRKKLSIKYTGENNPNYGNKWSEDLRKRASEQRKGKNLGMDNPRKGRSNYQIWAQKYGEEEALRKQKTHAEKISKANKGKKKEPLSEEHKQKISKKLKGYKQKQETKLKNSKNSLGESNANSRFNYILYKDGFFLYDGFSLTEISRLFDLNFKKCEYIANNPGKKHEGYEIFKFKYR